MQNVSGGSNGQSPMAAALVSLSGSEKKHWWLSNRKVRNHYPDVFDRFHSDSLPTEKHRH